MRKKVTGMLLVCTHLAVSLSHSHSIGATEMEGYWLEASRTAGWFRWSPLRSHLQQQQRKEEVYHQPLIYAIWRAEQGTAFAALTLH